MEALLRLPHRSWMTQLERWKVFCRAAEAKFLVVKGINFERMPPLITSTEIFGARNDLLITVTYLPRALTECVN